MLSLVPITLFAAAASAALYPNESNQNHTCQLTNFDKVLSCSNQANVTLTPNVDTCCVETYGGQFLSTQFWDTYTGLESQGQLLPPNTWTLHGLWPDFCNGSFDSYCDLNRQYDPAPSPNVTSNGTTVPAYKGPGVSTFIESFGKYDLLKWMNTYWINQGAPNQDFWGHEFSKHATCYSTFEPSCYGPQYRQHEEVIDFYETAIQYYRQLPTWTWLQQAGITPSNSSTYSLSQFQGALSAQYGAVPYVGCSGPRYNETAAGKNSTDSGRTAISEVWYYFHAYGRPQAGKWVPNDANTPTSSCAKVPGALHYYERSNGSVRAHTTGPF